MTVHKHCLISAAGVIAIATTLACTSPNPAGPASIRSVPERPDNVAYIEGRVVDASATPVDGAEVSLRAANAACSALSESSVRGVTDTDGTFSSTVSGGTGPATFGCVVIDTSAGNVTTRTFVPVFFESAAGSSRNHATVQIRLDSAHAPTDAEAEHILELLRSAINSMDRDAVAAIDPWVPGQSDTLWPAVDTYRRLLGHVERVSYAGGEPRMSRWILHGVAGHSQTVKLVTGALTRLESPVLDYAAKAESFIHSILDAATTNDIARMQNVLSSSDPTVGTEDARRLIDAIRTTFDPSTASPAIVGVDESARTFEFRLGGLSPEGDEVERTVTIEFANGLVMLGSS